MEIFANLTVRHREIVFDLVSPNGTLLKNVRVRRLHPLDRRTFNVSSAMLTDTLDDHMLFEHIIYHLMMGVEHFYIFDNRFIYPLPTKNNNNNSISSNSDVKNHFGLKNSVIRPFLDANLVTLVYFPFWPSTVSNHYNSVQRAAFFAVMQQFGAYNKFISLLDTDEFYLPSADFHHLLPSHINSNTQQATAEASKPTFISTVLQSLMEEKEPQRYPAHKNNPIGGVNLVTLDMACGEKGQDTRGVKRNSSETSAAVTHCNREGVVFREFALVNGTFCFWPYLKLSSAYTGRGKCFFRPEHNYTPRQPHNCNNPVLATEQHGGIVCHYTNFRLTYAVAGTDDPAKFLSRKETTNNCHDFAIKMLKTFVHLEQHGK